MSASLLSTGLLKHGQALATALLLSFEASAARDPFTPPEKLLCEPAVATLPLQLRGIIGRPTDYRAWLVADGGKGRLWAKQSWPHHNWQLREISALGITLAPATSCRPPLRINLQGRLYETYPPAAPAADAVAGSAAARRPGAALSGIR